jgi:bla regulator protein blaR1
MSGHIGQGLTSGRKRLLGGAAALVIAIPLALGTAGCASKGGTHGAEASNGRYPWFETASIKLNAATACCAMTLSKDRLVATESASDMIMLAYGEQRPLKPGQVLGGPAWMKTEVFTIDAELPKSLSDQVKGPLHAVGPGPGYPEVPGTEVVKQVFRSLLINRFKLRIKHETKGLPVYELVLANSGPKIGKDETADQSCRITDVGPGKGLWLKVKSCDFDTFAGLLAAIPELRSRVLVDKTGLHGSYSFRLHWTPKMPPGMPKPARGGQPSHIAAPPKPSGPSLFTALQDQLGLTVKSATAPVDIIVIQHIENPTEN